MKLKLVFLLSLIPTFFSCKKCDVYYVNSNKTIFNAIAPVNYAGADYLNLSLTINRNDSLFVKNLQIIPLNQKEKFPKLNGYKMSSFSNEKDHNKPSGNYIIHKKTSAKNQVRIDDFYSNHFNLLPKYNRLTNVGTFHISYCAIYKSEEPIEMESFKVLVIAELIDRFGKTIMIKETLNFNRVEHCWTSYAFH